MIGTSPPRPSPTRALEDGNADQLCSWLQLAASRLARKRRAWQKPNSGEGGCGKVQFRKIPVQERQVWQKSTSRKGGFGKKSSSGKAGLAKSPVQEKQVWQKSTSGKGGFGKKPSSRKGGFGQKSTSGKGGFGKKPSPRKGGFGKSPLQEKAGMANVHFRKKAGMANVQFRTGPVWQYEFPTSKGLTQSSTSTGLDSRSVIKSSRLTAVETNVIPKIRFSVQCECDRGGQQVGDQVLQAHCAATQVQRNKGVQLGGFGSAGGQRNGDQVLQASLRHT